MNIAGTRALLDATDFTALWQCTLCHELSIHLTIDDAEQTARRHHARIHPTEPTWPKQKRQCEHVACDLPAIRKGLCNTHSIAAYRAARKEPA